MIATAQIRVHIDGEGRTYPAGSDTPIPADAIVYVRHDLRSLNEGDIVIEAGGKPFVLETVNDAEFASVPTLMARDIARPQFSKTVSALVQPLIRIYSNGESRDDWIG